MTQILQILPRVPPAVCGIGDYAWQLAQALRDGHDIQSSFLSAGTSWTQPQGETEFPVFRLPQLTAQALVDFIAARAGEYEAVVLHMSPYGYQKRAVPLWLASAWRQLAQLKSRPRLLTMFHELYASGPVTSSAFWLQPLQKHVLRTVACASDSLRTNREAYADWLRQVTGRPGGEVIALPVFSNFGEPANLPPWDAREPAMALFGWGIHSGESLEAIVAKAAGFCQRFDIKKLHLIGGGAEPLSVPAGLELVRHGYLAASAVSALLQSCRMAYTAYSAEHFGKSTLMAALAAHGLAVIVQGHQASLPDGLGDGLNVIHESSVQGGRIPDSAESESLGQALRQWYERHSLSQNATSYATQLRLLEPVAQPRKTPPC